AAITRAWTSAGSQRMVLPSGRPTRSGTRIVPGRRPGVSAPARPHTTAMEPSRAPFQRASLTPAQLAPDPGSVRRTAQYSRSVGARISRWPTELRLAPRTTLGAVPRIQLGPSRPVAEAE